MKVYQAINKVQADLASIGITKGRTNTQGATYKFRGIDDIYNTVSPLLAKHGLCILPRVIARESVDRLSKSGGALFYVTVEVEFDFVSAEDGSKHTVKTFGEAMDSSDKATNKAMSAAYKYACLQAFAIPTEGDNDADAHTPEIAPKVAKPTLVSLPPSQASIDLFKPLLATANAGGKVEFSKAWKALDKEARALINTEQMDQLQFACTAFDETKASQP